MSKCNSYITTYKYWQLGKKILKRTRHYPNLITYKNNNHNQQHGKYSNSYYNFKEKNLTIGAKYYFK